jgi:DNA-directed RNA polymerase specialized sigma24 family protein
MSMLVGIAVGRFGIAEGDAEALAHEVFVDLILKAERITDARAWLVASIYNASRYYLRVRGRSEQLPARFAEQPDPHLVRVLEMWPDQLAARQAFSCTTARCQLALRLRFLESFTIPEIAAELGTTKRYAAKLVAECLGQAQRRYERMNQVALEHEP